MAASSFPCRSSFSALRSVAARSMGTDGTSVNGIKQRRRPERSPMHVRVAESWQRRRGDRPSRSPCGDRNRNADRAACSSTHQPVAGHLRHDRGGGDGRAPAVAVHDAALRHRQVGHAERVDEHDVGQRRQRQDGALHRPQRRLVDVDAVDFGRIGRRHGPGHGASRRSVVEPLALGRRHELRVADARECAGPGSSTTAAATTGPARQPRPTSSTPATCTNPRRRSAFSSVRVRGNARQPSSQP